MKIVSILTVVICKKNIKKNDEIHIKLLCWEGRKGEQIDKEFNLFSPTRDLRGWKEDEINVLHNKEEKIPAKIRARLSPSNMN